MVSADSTRPVIKGRLLFYFCLVLIISDSGFIYCHMHSVLWHMTLQYDKNRSRKTTEMHTQFKVEGKAGVRKRSLRGRGQMGYTISLPDPPPISLLLSPLMGCHTWLPHQQGVVRVLHHSSCDSNGVFDSLQVCHGPHLHRVPAQWHKQSCWALEALCQLPFSWSLQGMLGNAVFVYQEQNVFQWLSEAKRFRRKHMKVSWSWRRSADRSLDCVWNTVHCFQCIHGYMSRESQFSCNWKKKHSIKKQQTASLLWGADIYFTL